MEKVTRISLLDQPLFRAFMEIPDPRVGGRCLYPLFEIIFITLCALICGSDSWKGIESFGKKRRRWLSQFLELKNGIPSQLTFARVFSRIDPIAFEQCMRRWIYDFVKLMMWDIVNIDGKTARGSGHSNGEKKKMHLLNAYHARNKISLGSERTAEKSNEIKAIPVLLKSLNLTGTIITIDAMGTQKGIANLIRDKKAHYVLALKKNHKRFYRKVESTFQHADALQFESMVQREAKTDDYGHHRIEEREYSVLPMMYFHKYKKTWRDLTAVVRVKSKRTFLDGNKKDEISVRYYITSIPFKKHQKMFEAIRTHWSIENKLHYKLDLGMHEDNCQIFRGFADQNLAAMRKVVLNLLEKEFSFNGGVALKRQQAALSTRYLRKVLNI